MSADAVLPGGWRTAALFYAASVALRIPIALATRVPGIDEALLFGYGSSWIRTGQYDGIQWPVVYPLLVGAAGMVIGSRLAVELIFVLVGSTLVIPLYLGMRRLRGETAARWAALFVLLLPAVGTGVAKSGSHSIYLPLLGLGFLLHVLVLERATPWRLAGLGLVLGACYVTRTDGLVYLGVVATSMLAGEGSAGSRVRRVLLVVAASALFVVPNVVHLHHHTGRWQFSAVLGRVIEQPFYIMGLQDERLARMNEELAQAEGRVLAEIARRPEYVARKLAYNTRAFLKILGDIHVFPAVFFAPLGLTLLAFLRGWGRGALLLAAWASPPLAFLALNVEQRYFSPMALFLMLFTGEGWAALQEAARASGRRGVFGLLAAAAVAALLAMNGLAVAIAMTIEERGIPAKVEAILEVAGSELPDTSVLNPHLRFVIDGRPGRPRSAPLPQRCCSRLYVLDENAGYADEHALFEEIRSAGGRFELVVRREGLVVWRRVDAPPRASP